jgi:hypothetical protein
MSKYRNLQEAMADPDLYCTSVAAIMMDLFDAEWLEWEPETIEIELKELNVDLTSLTKDKLMCVSTLLGTNLFHTSFVTWNNLLQVLNFDVGHPELFVPAGLDDVIWGCTEARLLEGPEVFDQEGFSDDIRTYTGQILSSHGITKPPSVLEFAAFDENEIRQRDDALTGDEFIFKAYWDNQTQTISEMESMVIDKTKELFRQLTRLPLKTADSSFLQKLSEGAAK